MACVEIFSSESDYACSDMGCCIRGINWCMVTQVSYLLQLCECANNVLRSSE